MFWKKLASVFVTFDETAIEKTDPSKPIKEQLSNTSTIVNKVYQSETVTPLTVYNTTNPTVNPDIKTHLLNLVKENNLDGVDYCEYSVQLEIAKAWPIAIEQKYQSTFAAMQGQASLLKQPFDKEKLVTSANFYKDLIQKAIVEFQKEFDTTYKVEVEDQAKLVETKSKQMKVIAEQMAELNTEIQSINAKISQSDSKLKINKDIFINTGNTVLNEIDSEIEKINLYIS